MFEYFLIDVDMNPCMLTSRIRQATGAMQTFFQRCLMNLEPKVPPRVIDDRDWKWLKNYRVWEAARKVFLYPENCIEPELRDDKSPLFQNLESAILQQEIKNDNVEAAFADYLEGLDEISRLDVRGVWFEDRETHRMVGAAGPERPADSGAAPVGMGPGHLPHLRAHVQRTAHLVLPAARERTRLDALGKDRRRYRRRASRAGRLQPAHAPVLDDVPGSEQEAAAARAGRPREIRQASARIGRFSSRIRCTTADAGRGSGCPRVESSTTSIFRSICGRWTTCPRTTSRAARSFHTPITHCGRR